MGIIVKGEEGSEMRTECYGWEVDWHIYGTAF